MSNPTITVRVALTTEPAQAPGSGDWTDISAYVLTFATKLGRQYELDQFEPGTATLLLDNRTGRFSRNNASGAYYPNWRLSRRVNLRATFDGTTYDLFTGYIEAIQHGWIGTLGATATVRLADAFKFLALKRLSASFSAELSGERILNLLTELGWGSGVTWELGDASYSLLGTSTYLGYRDVDLGRTTVQAVTLADTAPLVHLRTIEQSEGGYCFFRPDGNLAFHDRHHRASLNSTPLAVFGDGGGDELPYQEITTSDDDTRIRNEIKLTRVGGAEQVVSDAASEAEHFSRTFSRSGLLQPDDSEVLDQANYFLRVSKDPLERIDAIGLKPQRDDRLWPLALGAGIGDLVTVVRRPPNAETIEQDSYIEAIEHRFSRDKHLWATHWSLSPASRGGMWVLDTAGYSVLGSTTRVGY